MRRPVPIYDFTAFGKAIKEARTKRGESRKNVSDDMDISPRYLANIENKGHFYELFNRLEKRPRSILERGLKRLSVQYIIRRMTFRKVSA